ncbi:MAG: hypothetical protein LBV38_01880 [Alistipes sp.]|jgi:hypothetical protein|nr:hypothetical protein [Alistipes sp.]
MTKSFLWVAALMGTWFLCSSDIAPYRNSGYAPFFMERAELERSVFRADTAAAIVDPGKIWIDGNNIYIVERYKGVHIVDNTDPAAPRNTGFIVAPGCMDVAVRDGVMYLDNAVDLVTFDLESDSVTSRLKNFLPEPMSPTGEYYYGSRHGEMILVGWKRVEKTEERR